MIYQYDHETPDISEKRRGTDCSGDPSPCGADAARVRRRSCSVDTFSVPEWLQYARAVYFDGYSPPVYPHIDEFDATRLIQTVLDLGGNLLSTSPSDTLPTIPAKPFRSSRNWVPEICWRKFSTHAVAPACAFTVTRAMARRSC